MTRLFLVVLATMVALAPQIVVRTSAATDNAWLIFVDDLHVSFVQTGRLRDLLRTVAAELIQEGDRYLFRANGPSAVSVTASALTDDRDLASSAIKVMTGNALKDTDILLPGSGTPAVNEVLYRANVALDAADEAVFALTRDAAPRQAIIYVSSGYDIETFPALAERVRALARRARENNITIFAIDTRGFASLTPPDPRIDADALLRYTTATRRSLSIMVEETGGFVIDKSHEPRPDLGRINAQMR